MLLGHQNYYLAAQLGSNGWHWVAWVSEHSADLNLHPQRDSAGRRAAV